MAEREVITTVTTTTTTHIKEKDEPISKRQSTGEDPILNFLKTSAACLGVAIVLIIAMQPRVNISNSGGNNTIYLNK